MTVIAVLLSACHHAAPVVAPAPEPIAAPTPEAATAAYLANDFVGCARMFDAIAGVEPAVNAACCHARANSSDGAFAALDRAVAAGLRDPESLADEDLASLRDDPRWASVTAAVETAFAAWEQTLGDPALRRELLLLVEEDQRARFAWMANRDDPTAMAAVEASDALTSARMKEVVAATGWPGASRVGEDGAHAAWLLVQHADRDPAFQKDCLARMEALGAPEVAPADVAYLWDRLAINEGRPQRYGTQLGADGNPSPIEDEANVDTRRAEAGMSPLADYLAMSRAAIEAARAE